MPDFLDPFIGTVPDRKLTDRELSRALRLSLAAEEEAIHLYEALADATDNDLAREVLQDIADEERVHAGEFQRLLNLLLADEEKLLADGAEEVDEMAAHSTATSSEDEDESEESEKDVPTIGSLKDQS
jgi:rubrerythrin